MIEVGSAGRVHAEASVQVASPEDVIIKKLECYQQGGSDKHLRDIAGVLRIVGAQLDRGYIREWAERLRVSDLWREVHDELDRGGE